MSAAAAALVLFVFAASLTACRGPAPEGDGITIVPPEATATAPTTAVETPAPIHGSSSVRSLADLSPSAASLLEGADFPVSAAIAIPERDVTYLGGDAEAFPLASVVKVPLLLAELQRARAEGRALTPEDREQLRAMITFSDNEVASLLFARLGQGPGLSRLLAPMGGDRFTWPSDSAWGDTAATARDLADFLAHLATGEGVAPEDRAFALELMQDVTVDQRWGASVGLNLAGDGVILAIKNGWYPEASGWRIVSAAIVVAGDLEYVIVLMTEDQPEHSEGVWLLEQIAGEVHHALLPPVFVADIVRSLAPPDPAAALPGEDGEPGEGEPSTSPPPSMSLIALAGSDVLVPSDARLVSVERAADSLSYVFQVEADDAQAVLDEYESAMVERGWTPGTAGSALLLTSADFGRVVLAEASMSGQGRVLLQIAFGTG